MPEPRSIFVDPAMRHAPEWDGIPCEARRCLVRVLNPSGDGMPIPNAWYRGLVGAVRPAVEVVIPDGISEHAHGRPGETWYIDDEGGWAWVKLTQRHGSRHVVSGRFHRVDLLDVYD